MSWGSTGGAIAARAFTAFSTPTCKSNFSLWTALDVLLASSKM
jgi:hypothetical protein